MLSIKSFVFVMFYLFIFIAKFVIFYFYYTLKSKEKAKKYLAFSIQSKFIISHKKVEIQTT